MIKIERSSGSSLTEQVAEQLKYQIASGVYNVDDTVPATRKLATQLGISFHTVRKAYQKLVEEGMLSAQQGSGYKVLARTPLSKEERLERGATIVQDALQRLVGLGLEETDIDYLFQEQLTIFDNMGQGPKVVYVAPYIEMAENCALSISSNLQIHLECSAFNTLEEHHDADYFFCRHKDVHTVSELFPRVDVMGTSIYLSPHTLDRIAHLFAQETLGILTYYRETIPHLMSEIQAQTGFCGQIFGASLEEGTSHLNQFIDQTDLVVYTPRCKRRILSFSKKENMFTMISHEVSKPSLQAIQEVLPTL